MLVLSLFLSLQFLILLTTDLYSKFNQNDYNIQFTRLEVADYNKDLYEKYVAVTFKYNRSTAVANVTIKTKIKIDNKNTQVIGQVYKFYSNEYRTFPLRIQLNYCHCVSSNLLGMKGIFACGNMPPCDLDSGETYHICNIAPDQRKFPPLMPSGQYKLEMTLYTNDSLNVMYNTYGRVYRALE